ILVCFVCMEIDPRKIAAELKKESQRKHNATLRLDGGIYKAFQDICSREGIAASHVVELFMREFNEKNASGVSTEIPIELSPVGRKIIDLLSGLDDVELTKLLPRLDEFINSFNKL